MAVWICKCGFKCDETQLGKTDGACPKCNNVSRANAAKYGA